MFALAGCNEAGGRMDDSLSRRQKRNTHSLHIAQLTPACLHPLVHLSVCVCVCVSGGGSGGGMGPDSVGQCVCESFLCLIIKKVQSKLSYA